MKNNQQGIRKTPALFREGRLLKGILVIALMLTISFAVDAQTSSKSSRTGKTAEQRSDGDIKQPQLPTVDHHMHIWSVNASAQVTDPVMPAVKLPEDFARLLRDKEQFGGQEKNVSALSNLYTEDALV